VLDGFKDWKYLYSPDAGQSRLTKEGWSKTRPTLEQGNQILGLIDEGLQQGGLGNGYCTLCACQYYGKQRAPKKE
jgi:hypothetical protein